MVRRPWSAVRASVSFERLAQADYLLGGSDDLLLCCAVGYEPQAAIETDGPLVALQHPERRFPEAGGDQLGQRALAEARPKPRSRQEGLT